MQIPSHIDAAGVAGKSLTYTWNLDVSRAIRHPLDSEHLRLANALSLVDVHASFALVLASAECGSLGGFAASSTSTTRWRAGGGLRRPGQPHYAEIPLPKEPFPQDQQDAHGPLKLARILLSQAHGYYAQGDRIVAAVALSMVLLARHVCPQPKRLDAWLTGALRKCHQFFPRQSAKSRRQVSNLAAVLRIDCQPGRDGGNNSAAYYPSPASTRLRTLPARRAAIARARLYRHAVSPRLMELRDAPPALR